MSPQSSEPISLDQALLQLNDWHGKVVRVLLLIRLGASEEPPPSGRGPGWHVVLGREAELGRPNTTSLGKEYEDWLRQGNIGTYELGDGPLKLLLDGLPCERALSFGRGRLALYLPGGAVVLQLELVSE